MHLFNAHDGDVDPRPGRGQAAVALVGDEDDGTGLGHGEVGPADAEVRRDELLASTAGRSRPGSRVVHQVARPGGSTGRAAMLSRV